MTSGAQIPETLHSSKGLVETIRQGTAPLVIRRKGALGELPASPAAKIEILVALTNDADVAIRAQAMQTLAGWNPWELSQYLQSADVPPDVLLFAARVLARTREDVLDALLKNPTFDGELQNILMAELAATAATEKESQAHEPDETASQDAVKSGSTGPERLTTLQKVSRMTPAQKIKCALTGNQEERFILIRDSNKMVARAVLQSPKLSEAEAEAFASMKNVSEEVLRLIALNRGFLKSYVVVRALVNNPRTPLDVTLPLINRMNDRDMRTLSVNKNVPDALRTTAAKTLMARQSTRGPSFGKR